MRYFVILSGDSVKSERYQSLSQSRIEAIADIMWNNEDGVWYDFNFKTKTQRRHFYPSNVFPLYVGCQKSIGSTDYEARVRDYLQVLKTVLFKYIEKFTT